MVLANFCFTVLPRGTSAISDHGCGGAPGSSAMETASYFDAISGRRFGFSGSATEVVERREKSAGESPGGKTLGVSLQRKRAPLRIFTLLDPTSRPGKWAIMW